MESEKLVIENENKQELTTSESRLVTELVDTTKEVKNKIMKPPQYDPTNRFIGRLPHKLPSGKFLATKELAFQYPEIFESNEKITTSSGEFLHAFAYFPDLSVTGSPQAGYPLILSCIPTAPLITANLNPLNLSYVKIIAIEEIPDQAAKNPILSAFFKRDVYQLLDQEEKLQFYTSGIASRLHMYVYTQIDKFSIGSTFYLQQRVTRHGSTFTFSYTPFVNKWFGQVNNHHCELQDTNIVLEALDTTIRSGPNSFTGAMYQKGQVTDIVVLANIDGVYTTNFGTFAVPVVHRYWCDPEFWRYTVAIRRSMQLNISSPDPVKVDVNINYATTLKYRYENAEFTHDGGEATAHPNGAQNIRFTPKTTRAKILADFISAYLGIISFFVFIITPVHYGVTWLLSMIWIGLSNFVYNSSVKFAVRFTKRQFRFITDYLFLITLIAGIVVLHITQKFWKPVIIRHGDEINKQVPKVASKSLLGKFFGLMPQLSSSTNTILVCTSIATMVAATIKQFNIKTPKWYSESHVKYMIIMATSFATILRVFKHETTIEKHAGPEEVPIEQLDLEEDGDEESTFRYVKRTLYQHGVVLKNKTKNHIKNFQEEKFNHWKKMNFGTSHKIILAVCVFLVFAIVLITVLYYRKKDQITKMMKDFYNTHFALKVGRIDIIKQSLSRTNNDDVKQSLQYKLENEVAEAKELLIALGSTNVHEDYDTVSEELINHGQTWRERQRSGGKHVERTFSKPSKMISNNNNDHPSENFLPTDIRQPDPKTYFTAMKQFIKDDPIQLDDLQKYQNIDLIFVDKGNIARQFIRGGKTNAERRKELNPSENQWISTLYDDVEQAIQRGARVYARAFNPRTHQWMMQLNPIKIDEKQAIPVDIVYQSLGRVIAGSAANFAVVDGYVYFNKHTLMPDAQSAFRREAVPAYIKLISYKGDTLELSRETIIYDDENYDLACIDNKFVRFTDPDGKQYQLKTLTSMKHRNYTGAANYFYYDLPSSAAKRCMQPATVVNIMAHRMPNDIKAATDPLMQKGSSGAALLAIDGTVIGIHVGKFGVSIVAQTLPNSTKWSDILYAKKVEDYVKKRTDIFVPISKMENQSESIFSLNLSHYPKELQDRLTDFTVYDDHEYSKKYLDGLNAVKIGNIPQVKFRPRGTLVVDGELVELCENNAIEDGEYGITVGNLDVIYKDARKYATPQREDYDEELLIKAIKFVRKQFSFLYGTPFVPPEIVLRRIRRQTSPGGLWTLLCSTKGQVIEKYAPMLYKYMKDILEGKPIPTIMVSSAWKEELRLLEKILDGKVRTMVPVPIEVVCSFQMVFGNMMDIISNHDFRITKMAVGFSPYFGGWDALEHSFDGFDKYVETDISKYDSHVRNNIKTLMFNHFWSTFFVTPYEETIAWNVYSSLYHVQFLLPDGNVLYFPDGGRWSGEPLTACENSLINYVLFVYACYKQGFSDEYILNDTQCIFMGDDARCGFRRETTFSFDSWMDAYEQCGFPVGETQKKFLERFDVSFCSLKTLPRQYLGRYVFVPIDTKMLSSLRVCKKTATPVHKMQKLISIYQYCYFTEEAPQMLSNIYSYYQKYMNDREMRELMDSCDVKYVSQYFLPLLQSSALQINESADKIVLSSKSMLSFRYHGKYCGPGWSAGKWQSSVRENNDNPEPETPRDRGCLHHDDRYATHGADLAHADDELAAIGYQEGDYPLYLGMKLQSLLRKLNVLERYNSSIIEQDENSELEMAKTNKSMKNGKKTAKVAQVSSLRKQIKKVRKQIRAKKVKVPRMPRQRIERSAPLVTTSSRRSLAKAYNKNSVTAPVTRIPISVTQPTTTDAQGFIYSVSPISPDLFYNTEIGQMNEWYERFRVKRMWIEMDSNCLATNGGSCFIVYDRDVTDSKWQSGATVDYASIISSTKVDIINYFTEKSYRSSMHVGSGWKYTSTPNSLSYEPNLRYDGLFAIGCVMPPSTSAQLAQFYLCAEIEFKDRVNEYESPYFYYGSVNDLKSKTNTSGNLIYVAPTTAKIYGRIGTYINTISDATALPVPTNFMLQKVTVATFIGATNSTNGFVLQFYVPGDYYVSVNINNVNGSAAPSGSITGSGGSILTFNNAQAANNTGWWNGWVRKTSGVNVLCTLTVSQTTVGAYSSNGSAQCFVMRTSVNSGDHGNFTLASQLNTNVPTAFLNSKNSGNSKLIFGNPEAKIELPNDSIKEEKKEEKKSDPLSIHNLSLYKDLKANDPSLTIDDFIKLITAIDCLGQSSPDPSDDERYSHLGDNKC